jgi:hypothetical protein
MTAKAMHVVEAVQRHRLQHIAGEQFLARQQSMWRIAHPDSLLPSLKLFLWHVVEFAG